MSAEAATEPAPAIKAVTAADGTSSSDGPPKKRPAPDDGAATNKPEQTTPPFDPEEHAAKKRASRREANRVHAFKSRQRSKALLQELQRTVEQLSGEKSGLERENAVLRAQVEVLQQQNFALTQSQRMLLIRAGQLGTMGGPAAALGLGTLQGLAAAGQPQAPPQGLPPGAQPPQQAVATPALPATTPATGTAPPTAPVPPVAAVAAPATPAAPPAVGAEAGQQPPTATTANVVPQPAPVPAKQESPAV